MRVYCPPPFPVRLDHDHGLGQPGLVGQRQMAGRQADPFGHPGRCPDQVERRFASRVVNDFDVPPDQFRRTKSDPHGLGKSFLGRETHGQTIGRPGPPPTGRDFGRREYPRFEPCAPALPRLGYARDFREIDADAVNQITGPGRSRPCPEPPDPGRSKLPGK